MKSEIDNCLTPNEYFFDSNTHDENNTNHGGKSVPLGWSYGQTFGLLQAKRGYRMQMVGTLYLTTDHRRPFTTIKKKKKKGVVFDECHNPFTLKIPFVDFKKE